MLHISFIFRCVTSNSL